MKIDRINYSESIECINPITGLKNWKKMEMGAELSEGEDHQEAAMQLKEEVLKAIGISSDTENPVHQYDGSGKFIINKKEPEEIRIGLFAEDINSCKDMETLKGYRLLVKGKPELQKAYDNKLKELSK